MWGWWGMRGEGWWDWQEEGWWRGRVRGGGDGWKRGDGNRLCTCRAERGRGAQRGIWQSIWSKSGLMRGKELIASEVGYSPA